MSVLLTSLGRVRQLAKFMMRSDQLNWHDHGSYAEKTALLMNVNVTDEDE